VTAIGSRERSRAARYDNDVQRLLANTMSPAQFDRRWQGKTIGQVSLPNWRQVVAVAQQGKASFDTFYPSRTP
jgi:ABC-type iron transport system FetAB ATPase subunit